MTRKRIVVACAAIVSLGAVFLYHFYGGGTAPDRQQPLVGLNASNVSTLKDEFNGSAKSVRLLVMLSPT
jgi:hypothetical protein